MQGTEVVDDDPLRRADTSRRGHAPATRVEHTAVALLIVSAVLCVVAPFQQLFVWHSPLAIRGVLSTTTSTVSVDVAVDGWGRYPVTPLGGVGHGARYGIALCAVAALLLAVAMLRIRALVRGSASPTRGLLPATVGVLTGVLGTVLLDVQSFRDDLNVHSSQADAGTGTETMTVGWMVWLTLIAWAAALIGSTLPSVMGRRHGDA